MITIENIVAATSKHPHKKIDFMIWDTPFEELPAIWMSERDLLENLINNVEDDNNNRPELIGKIIVEALQKDKKLYNAAKNRCHKLEL